MHTRTLTALKCAAALMVLVNLCQYVQMYETGRASFGVFLLFQTTTNLILLAFCLYRPKPPTIIVPPLPELSSLGSDLLGDGEPRFGAQQARTALYVIATHMGTVAAENPDTAFRSEDGTDMRPIYHGAALALLSQAQKRQNHPNTIPANRPEGA